MCDIAMRTLRPGRAFRAAVLTTWADISRAESLLDWRPQIRFADGIARLVDWYRLNQAWAKDISTS